MSYALVPELSLSRYLWTSKIRPVVVPSGFVTVMRAGPDPLDTKVSAEVQLFPGSRISWEVALKLQFCERPSFDLYDILTDPALRIAVTAAWTEVAHALMSGTSWGSFILSR
jgi:hypothetical protein